MVTLFIIAHAPLASAFQSCVRHVMSESRAQVLALDVSPDETPAHEERRARAMLAESEAGEVLILTDVCGATPCNVALRLADGVDRRILCGLSMPMLLRAATYSGESLQVVMDKALGGVEQGVFEALPTPSVPTPDPNPQCARPVYANP